MRLKRIVQSAAQAILIVLLLFILVVVIQTLTRQEPAPLAPVPIQSDTSTPIAAKKKTPAVPTEALTTVVPAAKSETQAPYPPPAEDTPETDASATPLPGPPPEAFPETPSLPAGNTAATLHSGDLWLLDPITGPSPLTELGDVSVVFDVSPNGTQLLFGRGRYPTEAFAGDTAELWLLDLESRDVRPFVSGQSVQLTAWSPAEDRIAICEYPNQLTIEDLEGQARGQLPNAICGFTWSPDGKAIAVPTFTPEMVSPLDGLLFTVMTIWWPEEDRIQLVNEATGEVHGLPLWSIDGTRLLFDRTCHTDIDKQPLSGAHVFDLTTNQITRLDSASPGAYGYTRSPKADRIAYVLGEDILLMDFEGRSEVIGTGNAPLWLPNGSTLLYRAPDGRLETAAIEIELLDRAVGGHTYATGFYLGPSYFILPNEAP